MRLSPLRHLFWTLGLSLLTITTAQGSALYSVTDLGTLPGTTQSEARGINASGQIVGVSYNTTVDGSDAQSFIYTNGQMTAVTPIGGGPAYAINDSGQVVGGKYTGINNAGDIIGGVGPHGGNAVTIGGTVVDTGNFAPFSINNSGVLAGSIEGTGFSVPSTWKYATGAQNLNSQLNTTSAQGAEVLRINDAGDLLVLKNIQATNPTATLLYNAAAHSVTNISDLVGNRYIPGPGFPGAIGTALNNHDQIVGNGWLYSDGTVSTLNSLIPAGSGWNLTQALGINDSGQIVGTGTLDGQTRAFLLSPTVQPVPEPGTIVIFAFATIAGVGTQRLNSRRNVNRATS